MEWLKIAFDKHIRLSTVHNAPFYSLGKTKKHPPPKTNNIKFCYRFLEGILISKCELGLPDANFVSN